MKEKYYVIFADQDGGGSIECENIEEAVTKAKDMEEECNETGFMLQNIVRGVALTEFEINEVLDMVQ